MLTFPYWEELRDGRARTLPVVPITLRHRVWSDERWISSMALLDSGAEHSVFPIPTAEELGYDLTNQRPVPIVGVGGAHSKGYAALADYELGDEKWKAPIIFSEVITDRPLLGQIGFFDFFNVSFRRHEREIRMTRSRKSRVVT